MTNTEKTVTTEMHDRILDFVAYVSTSTRALYKEPHTYGPMRMVDTLEKAITLLAEAGVEHPSIEEAMNIIRENRWRVTSDPEAFANTVDEAILRLVRLTV